MHKNLSKIRQTNFESESLRDCHSLLQDLGKRSLSVRIKLYAPWSQLLHAIIKPLMWDRNYDILISYSFFKKDKKINKKFLFFLILGMPSGWWGFSWFFKWVPRLCNCGGCPSISRKVNWARNPLNTYGGNRAPELRPTNSTTGENRTNEQKGWRFAMWFHSANIKKRSSTRLSLSPNPAKSIYTIQTNLNSTVMSGP